MNTTLNQQSYCQFAEDVRLGLSKRIKELPSKYFYDEKGSQLFQEITNLPEYYLTKCEKEILQNCSSNIGARVGHKNINVYDLGPGDGTKTLLLLNGIAKGIVTKYLPVDICADYLKSAISAIQKHDDTINCKPILTDYFNIKRFVDSSEDVSKLFVFLGANIGNFDSDSCQDFIRSVRECLQPGDKFLIGFDLKKDIPVLNKAYNDNRGVTKKFNLNLLNRINRELGANFDEESFFHYGPYNPCKSSMESYLISTKYQEVYIESLDESFSFKPYEAIFVERSKKYDLEEIAELALANGMMVEENFTDNEKNFCNSLWKVV